MSCNNCGLTRCGCRPTGQQPYYQTDPCLDARDTCPKKIYVANYQPVIRIQGEWAVPEANAIVTLTVPALVDIMIGAVIWNPDYGSYTIVAYDGNDLIKVTKTTYNEAVTGTTIPSCTKFALTAPVTVTEVQVAALEVRVDDLEIAVDNLEGQVTVLEGQVTVLEGQVTALEAQVATLEEGEVYADFVADWNEGTGSGTVTPVTEENQYSVNGETVYVSLNNELTISVDTLDYIDFELPVAPLANSGLGQKVSCTLYNSTLSAGAPGTIYIDPVTDRGVVSLTDGTVLTVGTWIVQNNFSYRKEP